MEEWAGRGANYTLWGVQVCTCNSVVTPFSGWLPRLPHLHAVLQHAARNDCVLVTATGCAAAC
jgi:hypothetical protein